MTQTFETETCPPARKSMTRRGHGRKFITAALWLTAAAGAAWYAQAHNMGTADLLQLLVDFLRSPAGPLIFILIYAVRPLLFFSAAILTIAAGSIFGPLLGIVYTIIGSNLSATVAYLIGRYFGQGILEGDSDTISHHYATRLRANSFETVLIMRFIFLPYDLVNYLSGFLRIRYLPFILATILGSIPGTITFALFGASIDISGGIRTPSFNLWTFVASAALFAISLLLSRVFKQRESAASK